MVSTQHFDERQGRLQLEASAVALRCGDRDAGSVNCAAP